MRPLFVVGSHRSGTTMLRLMLNSHPQLTMPPESHFIPWAYSRFRERMETDSFLRFLQSQERFRDWDLSPTLVRSRLAPDMSVATALAVVFETYAAREGKSRWGDKTPDYVLCLPLLLKLFPDAQVVHLIRDGRDVAASFLARSESRSIWSASYHWTSRVIVGRRDGKQLPASQYLEIRYEDLVESPERWLREICAFADLPFSEEMLKYSGRVEGAVPERFQNRWERLKQPPTPGARNWRTELSPHEIAVFEATGGELLTELGYERGVSRIPIHLKVRAFLFVGMARAWHLVNFGKVRRFVGRRLLHPIVGKQRGRREKRA